MASTPAAPTAPAPQESVIARLLGALNTTLTSPKDAAILGMAEGLGQAGAPHLLTPVPLAQGLAMGLADAQKYQHQALANTLQQTALIPYQKARAQIATNVAQGNMYQLTPAEQAAVASGKFTPQILQKLSGMETQLKVLGVNTDSIPIFREAETWAKNNVTPTPQPANTRLVNAANAATGGAPPAQGSLPTGTAQGPGGAIAPLPGALPSIQGVSGAGAAGTFPYQSALKLTGLMQGPQSNQVLSLAPAMPPLFNPGLPTGSSPSPAAIQAAIATQRQRQMGTMQGVQATGGQLPGMLPPAPMPPSTGGIGPNPAPPGTPASLREIGATPAGRAHAAAVLRAATARPLLTLPQRAPAGNVGIISPGMSPAALAAAKSVGNATGAAVTEAAHVSDGARQQIALYDQMGQALSQMGPTGQWRDVSTRLGKLANYFGFTPFQITGAAEFTKYRSQLVGAATHAVSPRASTQEMDFLAKSVPDYNLPGNAAQTLVSELRGLSQYQVIKSNALPVYLQMIASKQGGNFQGTSLGFEKWFNTHGPSPSAIVIGSVVTNLPPAQRAAYVHRLQSTVTGRMMLQQYARARAFEAQFPGIFRGL